MGSGKKGQADTTDVAGVDADSETSDQEAVVIPVIFGQVRLKIIPISPVYNQFPVEAPATSGGKK